MIRKKFEKELPPVTDGLTEQELRDLRVRRKIESESDYRARLKREEERQDTMRRLSVMTAKPILVKKKP